jgi:hypothetical protein
MTEFFVLKMAAHLIDKALPELFAAFFVNRLVTDDSEFVRSRGYENQDRIAFPSFVHSETLKLFLCNDQRIGAQFAALNKNANLAGRFRFSFTNRFNNPVMLELVEKFFRSHSLPAPACAAAAA